jgi:hypothetical protein
MMLASASDISPGPWSWIALADSSERAARPEVAERRRYGTANARGRGRNLAESLRRLQDQGTIDGHLAEWASALRVLGNQGAHFSDIEVTTEDAQDSLALAETLLEYVYVWSERFGRFRDRRSNGKRDFPSGK